MCYNGLIVVQFLMLIVQDTGYCIHTRLNYVCSHVAFTEGAYIGINSNSIYTTTARSA